MNELFNMLGGMDQAQKRVSQEVGASPDQTAQAMEAAVPLLLGAMTRNASNTEGVASLAKALDKHDGSQLDQFAQGQAPNMQDGQKILGHVFGNQQNAAANAVSKRAGIDPQLAMKILMMAAPLVLGYLGRQRNQQGGATAGGGLDIGGMLGSVLGGGLGGMLGGQSQSGGSMIPGLPTNQNAGIQGPDLGSLGGMIGTLNTVLDRDGDGNGLEELIGMFGGNKKA